MQAFDPAISPHDRDSFERLKGADQDTGSDPEHLARSIQYV